jgi:hypothetical protein
MMGRMDDLVVDPRAEALARVDGRFDVRVLEPSPPAVSAPPFFADDPVHEPSTPGRPVVAPVALGDGATTWDDLVQREPELATWCADRWLGACRRLEPPADEVALVRTRNAWHVLAEHVLAPARHRVNGRIGLRYTRGGFGTPYFGDDEQVRVADEGLVVVRDGALTIHPISTTGGAAAELGIEPGAPTDVYTPTTALDPDAPLEIDPASARMLGDWFGFGASVLEALRAAVPASDEPARVQLWPEHFDLSVDLGVEASGHRGTYGASPGDEAHPAPYLYVTPWTPQSGAFWNEGSYVSLPFSELVAASDQRERAREFFAEARTVLTS